MAEWRGNDAEWYQERMIHCATGERIIARRYLSEMFDLNGKTNCS